MYEELRVAVVIPCFRVAHVVAGVVERIPEWVDAIIAVNDASPDDTGEVLASIQDPRLTVLTHKRNRGVGGAMASGFAKALEMEMDVVVKLDGDGQMAPEDMEELVAPIADDICDYAKGNRFLHFRALKAMPWTRKIGNIALTFLTKVASGYWKTFDPQNGYVAIRRELLERLNLDVLRTRRYFFENEMLIQLNIESARVLDCPMPSRYGDEVSSLRISHVLLYFPPFLLRGFLSRMLHRYVLRDFSIVVPLYLVGTALFLWGFLFGLDIVRNVKHHPGVPTPTGTIMLSVLPLILGVQMLLQGLLVDILETPKPGLSIRHRSATRRRRKSRHD